jgi:hypothetical protein
MSQKEKDNLKKFLQDHQNKIIITNQVQKEFLRNRVSTIDKFFSSIKDIRDKFETDLIAGVKNSFKSSIENKILKYDYPQLWSEIQNIFTLFETKLFNNEKLRKSIEDELNKIENSNKYLKIIDQILDLYQNFKTIEKLDKSEIDFLKKHYNLLLEKYKAKKDTTKWKISFPGCGERTDKEEPYGDFIIYHEMLKYMITNKTDVIFITNDVTKSDWLQSDLSPFIHYIQTTYENTKKVMYILHGRRILPEISFEQIYEKPETMNDHKMKFYTILNSVFKYLKTLKSYEVAVFETEANITKREELDIKITFPNGTIEGFEIIWSQDLSSLRSRVFHRIRTGRELLDKGLINSYHIYAVFDEISISDPKLERISDWFVLSEEIELQGRKIYFHIGYIDNDNNFNYLRQIK